MFRIENKQAIKECTKVFPNLNWCIEAEKTVGALYEGSLQTIPLKVYIEITTEGFKGSFMWNDEHLLWESIRPCQTLAEALQELKAEWHKLNEAMS